MKAFDCVRQESLCILCVASVSRRLNMVVLMAYWTTLVLAPAAAAAAAAASRGGNMTSCVTAQRCRLQTRHDASRDEWNRAFVSRSRQLRHSSHPSPLQCTFYISNATTQLSDLLEWTSVTRASASVSYTTNAVCVHYENKIAFYLR